MLKKGDQVSIHANRWMDSFGNTLHVVRVAVLRKGDDYYTDVGESEISYGYGAEWARDMGYEQTARAMLGEAFAFPRGWGPAERRDGRGSRPLWQLRDFGVELISAARDVKRKYELGYI